MKAIPCCGIAVLCAVLSATPAEAQHAEVGGDLLVGFPQNEFKRNTGAVGGGVSAHIGYVPEDSPILLGFRILFLNYGSEKRSDQIFGQYSLLDAEVITQNNILIGSLFLRLQPGIGRFRPFIEGFAGYNYLFTETSVRGRISGESLGSETNLDDGAFGYGAGGGIQFGITGENLDDPTASPDGLSLSASARYLFGGKAAYLKEGSIREENGRITYYTNESTTDLLMISLGLTYSF